LAALPQLRRILPSGAMVSQTARHGDFSHIYDQPARFGDSESCWEQLCAVRAAYGLDDQYTAELFYRLQVAQNVAITPDIQWVINPALNPEGDSIFVFGIRGRLTF
jgi:hypothetical protein